MPLKNYTTSVPADRSIKQIEAALVKAGATGILYEFDRGSGRISALAFRLTLNDNQVSFSLPVNWRQFQHVLKEQRVRQALDEDYVYRVAWRCLRDWVLAQLALQETAMVELPQVFLPFANTRSGQTLYQIAQRDMKLLCEGA